VTWDQLQSGRHTHEFKEMMCFEIARVRTMFLRGRPLLRKVSPGLSLELEATWRGGMKILDLIEERDYEVLDYRPTVDRRDVAQIAGRSLISFGRRFFRGEV
jgi:phytoene/squalene synthetase